VEGNNWRPGWQRRDAWRPRQRERNRSAAHSPPCLSVPPPASKLWDAATGREVGVLRGHKRGVWCVQFSPVDQVLASCSGDATVRIWALSDRSCLRTFEGHTNSVLKVTFATRGMQLLSSGSDGLVKLWNLRTGDNVATMDGHEDKVSLKGGWRLSERMSRGQVRNQDRPLVSHPPVLNCSYA
jgi:WD40 repeat protein